MEGPEINRLATQSLSFEVTKQPIQSNHYIFRKHVSKPILQLYKVFPAVWRDQNWKNGVNLALPMQAMFKTQSLAKLKSARHSQLLKEYDGGNPELASVVDV